MKITGPTLLLGGAAAWSSGVKQGWEVGDASAPLPRMTVRCQGVSSLWWHWVLLAYVIHAMGQLSWRQQVRSEKTLVTLTWFSFPSLDLFSEP